MRQILGRGSAAHPAPAADPYPCRKEEKQMNKLTQALMEELTVEYVKVGSLQIPASVVISWVIIDVYKRQMLLPATISCTSMAAT